MSKKYHKEMKQKQRTKWFSCDVLPKTMPSEMAFKPNDWEPKLVRSEACQQ